MLLLTKKFLFFALTIFILPFFAFPQSLSLPECLYRAEKFSPELKAFQSRYHAARENVQLEKAQNLPKIYGSFSFEHHRLTPYGFYQQWSLLESDWALGGFILKTHNIEQKRALAAQQEINAKYLQVARSTVTLFIEALKQKKAYTLLEQRLSRLQFHRRVAEALWKAGSKTELDVLQTESEILKLKEKMRKVLSKQKMLIDELAILIDWSGKDSLRLISFNYEKIADSPLPVLEKRLLEQHPLLQMFRFDLEATRLKKKAVQASQIPQLHLGYGFVVDHDPTGDGNYWIATAGIRFPLFQWNLTKIAREKIQLLFNALQSDQLNIHRQLLIEARKTLDKLANLKKILQLQRERLEKNQHAYQIASANYQAGLITNLEFLNAQEQFTEAQIALHNTQLDYALQLAQFYIITNQPGQIENW